MNSEVLSKYDTMTVGELPHTPDPKHVLRYVGSGDKQLDMVFQFGRFLLPKLTCLKQLSFFSANIKQTSLILELVEHINTNMKAIGFLR